MIWEYEEDGSMCERIALNSKLMDRAFEEISLQDPKMVEFKKRLDDFKDKKHIKSTINTKHIRDIGNSFKFSIELTAVGVFIFISSYFVGSYEMMLLCIGFFVSIITLGGTFYNLLFPVGRAYEIQHLDNEKHYRTFQFIPEIKSSRKFLLLVGVPYLLCLFFSYKLNLLGGMSVPSNLLSRTGFHDISMIFHSLKGVPYIISVYCLTLIVTGFGVTFLYELIKFNTKDTVASLEKEMHFRESLLEELEMGHYAKDKSENLRKFRIALKKVGDYVILDHSLSDEVESIAQDVLESDMYEVMDLYRYLYYCVCIARRDYDSALKSLRECVGFNPRFHQSYLALCLEKKIPIATEEKVFFAHEGFLNTSMIVFPLILLMEEATLTKDEAKAIEKIIGHCDLEKLTRQEIQKLSEFADKEIAENDLKIEMMPCRERELMPKMMNIKTDMSVKFI